MRIPVWIAAVLTAATFSTSQAAADTLEPASPHELIAETGDGRTVVLGQRGETIQHVTGLPVTTREARVTAEAYATLAGSSASAALEKGTLTIGYEVGCAIATGPVVLDLQSMVSVLGLNPNPAVGDSSTITVTPDDKGSPTTMATLYPGIAVSPSITMSFATGTIRDVPLATIPIHNGRNKVGIRRSEVKVTGCLGTAAIRSYAILTTKSALSDDTVVVYGNPVAI